MGRENRKQFLIDPSFQIQFILKFCIVVITSSLLIGGSIFLLTQNSTTVAIEDTKVLAKSTSDFILPSLAITISVVSVFSALVVYLLTLFVSHKIAGPIYRLRREIELIEKGDTTRRFNIRSKDQLQPLANSLSAMAKTFRSKNKEMQESFQELVFFLEKREFSISPDDKSELQKLLEKANTTLNYFKV